MNWLEILSVTGAGPEERIKIIELCGKLRVPRMSGRSAKLSVYGNSFSAELSVHIHWRSQAAPVGRSPLGLALGHTLGDYGLVTHSLWLEYDRSGGNT